MPDSSQELPSGKTQQKSSQKNSPTLTSSVLDSHVKLSVLLEKDEDSMIQGVHSFLKSQGLLKKNGHLFYYLKTSEGFYLTTKGKHSTQSLPPLMKLGTMSNGKCLTQNFLFHKTGNVSSLSDILEKEVDEKYFLSEKMTRKLVEKTT